MKADDVKQTLDLAVEKTGVNNVHVRHKPRLLSDNGSCYISGELRKYLEKHGIGHARGAPYHPMTKGKIERYHRTMKNLIKLQHYYMPGELEREIGQFVEYYNNQRYNESLDNVIPADVYYGKDKNILTKRDEIKKQTLKLRKQQILKERVLT